MNLLVFSGHIWASLQVVVSITQLVRDLVSLYKSSQALTGYWFVGNSEVSKVSFDHLMFAFVKNSKQVNETFKVVM